MTTYVDYVWLPVIMVALFVGWHLLRYLIAVWWLYFVFRPAVIRLLEEAFPDPED